MARCKEFDVEQALERAMETFWQKGFEATSMHDLQDSMGIGRQSLYDTFGDKQALFVAALGHYNARNAGRVRAKLLVEGASLGALRAWFDELVVALTPRGSRPGCLLANSILEGCHEDPQVGSICKAGERQLARGFETAAVRAIELGELGTGRPAQPDAKVRAKEIAEFLVAQVYGLTVLARNGASRATLERVAHRAFESIGAGG